MLINNWFDFLIHTFFIVFLGIGIGIIGSSIVLIEVLRKKEVRFSWKSILEKQFPFIQNATQSLLTAIAMISFSVYVLFIVGWFFKYIESVRLFFEKS